MNTGDNTCAECQFQSLNHGFPFTRYTRTSKVKTASPARGLDGKKAAWRMPGPSAERDGAFSSQTLQSVLLARQARRSSGEIQNPIPFVWTKTSQRSVRDHRRLDYANYADGTAASFLSERWPSSWQSTMMQMHQRRVTTRIRSLMCSSRYSPLGLLGQPRAREDRGA